jgi:tryptophan synthase alpha chain
MTLEKLFQTKNNHLLNIYFTAGFPNLNDTEVIIENLAKAGVDMIEVGMPYSDPLADGPTIQESGMAAIQNGMTLALLFEQLGRVRSRVEVPLILMGYFNQVMQFGEELFLQRCQAVGVQTVILPDLPLHVYEQSYQKMFQQYGVNVVFLLTPQTTDERIRKIDELSRGFIYVVADASITGTKSDITATQTAYFQRIKQMNLKNPLMIGFGISDKKSFQTVCQYANGAIIGSAFIKAVAKSENVAQTTEDFVKGIIL